MERILRRIKTTSQEEMLKKIAPPAGIRWHKVLDIRRRIAAGTYSVADRLDGVVERILEATSSAWERRPPPRRNGRPEALRPFGSGAGGDSGVLVVGPFGFWNEVRKTQ